MLVEGTRAEERAMALASLEQAQAALDEVRVGATEEDLDQARAARDAARADARRARRAVQEMTVTAPGPGIVESMDIRPGDIARPGPVARIVDLSDLTLRVYVSAAVLGQLYAGQEVTLTTDAHGDEVFTGRIVQVASQGEFTPRNLQTQEQRVQQVFGVKVRLDPADGKLRPGMAATARLPLAANGSALPNGVSGAP